MHNQGLIAYLRFAVKRPLLLRFHKSHLACVCDYPLYIWNSFKLIFNISFITFLNLLLVSIDYVFRYTHST